MTPSDMILVQRKDLEAVLFNENYQDSANRLAEALDAPVVQPRHIAFFAESAGGTKGLDFSRPKLEKFFDPELIKPLYMLPDGDNTAATQGDD